MNNRILLSQKGTTNLVRNWISKELRDRFVKHSLGILRFVLTFKIQNHLESMWKQVWYAVRKVDYKPPLYYFIYSIIFYFLYCHLLLPMKLFLHVFRSKVRSDVCSEKKNLLLNLNHFIHFHKKEYHQQWKYFYNPWMFWLFVHREIAFRIKNLPSFKTCHDLGKILMPKLAHDVIIKILGLP